MTRFSSLTAKLGLFVLSVAAQAHRDGLDGDAEKFIDLAQLIFDRGLLDVAHLLSVAPDPDE